MHSNFLKHDCICFHKYMTKNNLHTTLDTSGSKMISSVFPSALAFLQKGTVGAVRCRTDFTDYF